MENQLTLYKSVWYWNDEKCLTYEGVSEGKEKSYTKKQQPKDKISDKTINFLDNVDQNQQKLYKLKYQRTIKPNVPNVVTLQDIKDVVTFLMVGSMPNAILALIHSYKINKFFRSLVLYFQLYTQVCEDLAYRRQTYSKNRLKHPISIERETRCKAHLSNLRSRAGQEYALLVTGQGFYKRYHHMSNPMNRSYSNKDLKLYDYLVKFSARIVWVALYRSNYKEIEIELSRLFHSKNVLQELRKLSVGTLLVEEDRRVLYGDELPVRSHWDTMTPMISDVFMNSATPYQMFSANEITKTHVTGVCGLTALLLLPEEVLQRFNLSLGILGQPRDNFETMLHVKQERRKSGTEQELEKAFTVLVEVEKPVVKMYQYLTELETNVDLNASPPSENLPFKNVNEEIEFYLGNHFEDSRRASTLWKDSKGYIKKN